MAKYDAKTLVLTDRYKNALHELMAAEIEMMRGYEPDSAECWTWGCCEVGDIADFKALGFFFGGEEDRPAHMICPTTVIDL